MCNRSQSFLVNTAEDKAQREEITATYFVVFLILTKTGCPLTKLGSQRLSLAD